eukprot:GSChrysophyteH1.ASY1.ANO1.287.1 assembled CDS
MTDFLEEPAPKRRRRQKTNTFDFEEVGNEEKRLIQQAMDNSKRDTKREALEIPQAPVYYPTVEEFKNPLGWSPPIMVDMNDPRRFPTKRQVLQTLQEGQGFDSGKNYNIAEYKEMADEFLEAWNETHYDGNLAGSSTGEEHRGEPSEETAKRCAQLRKDYWDMVEMGTGSVTKKATVEYANDLDTTKYCSGFPLKGSRGKDKSNWKNAVIDNDGCDDMFSDEYYQRTGWNLVNIASSEGSVLTHLKTSINGVNVPWLYIGMLFSSFCWHNEDNYLYSINYSHFGAAKQWYGVPGADAKKFESVSKNFLLESFKDSPDLLHHMTTQISPSLLIRNGIPICQTIQMPRTFVVTFPKSMHAGFSYGFNCGEAVNFATSDWLRDGTEADERYRIFGRSSVFSHQRLLFTLLYHNGQEFGKSRKGQFQDKDSYKSLLLEIKKCLDEELLPSNNFMCIDESSSNYDDLRSCHYCKHICLLTALACECDRNKVACIRHLMTTCKCPKEKHYMLQWMSTEDMKTMSWKINKMLAGLK